LVVERRTWCAIFVLGGKKKKSFCVRRKEKEKEEVRWQWRKKGKKEREEEEREFGFIVV